MDPELQLLVAQELKSLEARQDELFNSGLGEDEKQDHAAQMRSWANLLVGLMEWLPKLKEHLKHETR